MSVIRYRTYNGTTRYKVRNPYFTGKGSFVCGYIPTDDSDSDIHFSIPTYYPNAIDDFDGNWYDAVVIGDQVWTVHNMRTTHYSDGTAIAYGGTNYSSTTPYYYNFSSSDIPLADRGYLYNWPATMNGAESSTSVPSGVQGIAPIGWHIPSWNEILSMRNYVISVYGEGLSAKALASQNYWLESTNENVPGNNMSSNNSTMLRVIPTGKMEVLNQSNVTYLYDHYDTWIWGATTNGGNLPCYFSMRFDTSTTSQGWMWSGMPGQAVRCVHNLQPIGFAAWYYNEYGSFNHQLTNSGNTVTQNE